MPIEPSAHSTLENPIHHPRNGIHPSDVHLGSLGARFFDRPGIGFKRLLVLRHVGATGGTRSAATRGGCGAGQGWTGCVACSCFSGLGRHFAAPFVSFS
jgi:hypothetical protein